ncbi:MAG: HAD-IA family hydrolase [Gammaproteobacteria bacterium]|nr:HAD-IA family hydrolase [Gammaproteobacteria bacterium]
MRSAVKRKRTIVLDAMGVIFRAEDDVAELLVPFLNKLGSTIDTNKLNMLYKKTSLGQLDVDEFWRELGLSPDVEDEYLALHELNRGCRDFLSFTRKEGLDAWCLSNDVSRWSLKLSARYALKDYFKGFVISGDIGYRKPSEQAYRCLIDRIGYVPDLFVDDRAANVSAAQSIGIRSVLFDANSDAKYGTVDFDALTDVVGQCLE